MFADDVVNLMDVVGGVDRHRQVPLLRRVGSPFHERHRAGLDLAWHQDTANPVRMRALMLLYELDRQIELAVARGFIDDADELAALPADPSAAVEAWAEISADTELADGFEQRLLHAQLTAKLDECRNAVAQKLRHCETGVQRQLLGRRIVIRPEVTDVAADPRALARHA